MIKKNWFRILLLIAGIAFVISGVVGLIQGDNNEVSYTDNQIEKEVDSVVEEEMDLNTEDQESEELDESDAVEVEDELVLLTNEGDLAPDFEFVDSSGNIYNNETFLGEKVYIKYWASWCSICLAGLDEIDTLFAEAEGFTVYTVVTPDNRGELSQEDFEEWFAGIDQKNIKVLFDLNGESATKLGVRAFPTQIFLGSDGVLISNLPGHQSNEDITEMIKSFY